MLHGVKGDGEVGPGTEERGFGIILLSRYYVLRHSGKSVLDATYDFRIFDMFCGACCYPDTKEESENQEQCSPRKQINENPKSRPDTIEHQENDTISPHFKTITYGRNRFGTYELSSSEESVMDILIHGRNVSTNISYPISPTETQGKQNENMSAFSGDCVNTSGEF